MLRAFAILRQCGLRPPDGWDEEAACPLWAAMLSHGTDDEVLRAFQAHAVSSKWWPTIAEIATKVTVKERAALPISSRCPTYDALDQGQRADIGEAILREARGCIDNDDALSAECERRARLIACDRPDAVAAK